MSKASRNHHYVPQGYLKRWTTQPENKLCVFQWNANSLAVRRSATAGTGYAKGLYSSEHHPEFADTLETAVMAPIDDAASRLLDVFNSSEGRLEGLDGNDLDAWSRFIMTLMHRSPGRIATIRADWYRLIEQMEARPTDEMRASYAAARLPGQPERVEDHIREYRALNRPEDVDRAILNTLAHVQTADELAAGIASMMHSIVDVSGAKFELLTSDRPLDQWAPEGAADLLFTLAISPTKLWVASTKASWLLFNAMTEKTQLVRRYNKAVCNGAERFVYGTSDAQMRFVENNFPKPKAADRAESFMTQG
jgi:hypothetical protein